MNQGRLVMKIIKRGTVTKYAFDNSETPSLRVAQGETFQIETEGAFIGLIADRPFPAI
jgi:hypothetical protein